MFQTKVTEVSALAGFAPAGKTGHAYCGLLPPLELFVATLRKLHLGKRAYAVFALCAATAIALPAQTLTTLFSFDGTDGQAPLAGLVQATNGDFYGTTFAGGSGSDFFCLFPNCGTVFKITPSGTLTTLYSFCSQGNCTDGYQPIAGLVQAASGDFYGTTIDTFFKITPSGTLTTLYTFCSQSNCTDGTAPVSLIQAANGDFYGTTYNYGANGNYGTVFKITPSGTLTTLYSFCSQSGCTDGEYPSGLVQATNGDFYGITQLGGANSAGTVFQITPTGALTTLHSFCSQSGCTDGNYPEGALVQGTDGSLYGTTSNGGPSREGTIFKITPGGALTTLHSFDGADGANPGAGLIQATNGEFYGTTVNGGDGTVFSLSVGLGPFVETQTTVGKVGAAVKILGTDLTGATSVSFNGTAAVFTVVSPSLIKTTVPAGATTGKVEVVIPSGTLSSNVPYRVKP
jgi:uncharacterized repeat protein (TIGR03803 family)